MIQFDRIISKSYHSFMKCKGKNENVMMKRKMQGQKRKMQGQKGKCKNDIKGYYLDRFEQVERSTIEDFYIIINWEFKIKLRRRLRNQDTSSTKKIHRFLHYHIECSKYLPGNTSSNLDNPVLRLSLGKSTYPCRSSSSYSSSVSDPNSARW